MKRNFFISYRRQSGGDYAKGIFDHLDKQADIGAVFFDRDPKSLPAGSEWPTELISKVLQSDVVLVIIDRSWTDELAKRNKENDEWIKDTDSTDWVRREVMFGLHFGKIVIPLLFEEAKPPTESDLPYDLSKLASKNALWMNLTASEFSNLESHLAETAPASPLSYDPPSEFLTGLTQTEDDLWSENGQEWSPAQSEDSPHRWDYKYTVTNPDERMRLRVALLASQRSGTLDNGFSLADLSKLGQHRCFGHSEKKKGMFIQASCIVTDGRKGKTDHLLMSLRSPTQFHDEVYGDTPIEHSKRFTEGVSCLIGTCLSDFNFHEQTAHLSRAVFNDLQEFNPWAVFSRKLLIPALFVDSRFLGIGYNLNNPDKEYLHFIWHVRTEDCPPAMLVPAREKANFDLASWETLEDVSKYDFAGCGIDRLAVESLLGVSLPWPKKKAPTIFHGFARYQGLEGTQGVHADQAQTWRREAIPIDLIRMFQQERHGGLNQSEIHDAASLKIALVHYLESLKDIKDFTIVLEDGPQEDSTIISLKDRDGEETSCFQVLHYVTETLNLSDDDINTIRDNSLNVLPNGKHPASTLIVQGVRTSQRYTLNGAELLSTSNNAPIHLIKIALEKTGASSQAGCTRCHSRPNRGLR